MPMESGVVDIYEAGISRRFFKSLVLKGAGNILCTVTGSAMATFWANMALSPTGDYPPCTTISR